MEKVVFVAALCCVQAALTTLVPDGAPWAAPCGAEAAGEGCERAPLLERPSGGGAALSCGAHRFVAYPQRARLSAQREAGRYRVLEDGALRAPHELLCTDVVLLDTPYAVFTCPAHYEERAYLVSQEGGGARQLVKQCFDAARGRPAVAEMLPREKLLPKTPAESLSQAFLSVDYQGEAHCRAAAERVLADEARLAAALRGALRRLALPPAALAGETLVAAPLLSPLYFKDQYLRLADSWSNKVAVWRSVAAGNLRGVQRDVAALRARVPGLRVLAGAAGVATLRDERGANASLLYLEAGEAPDFAVAKYIWTLVVNPEQTRALFVIVLNDPFVSTEEARAAPCRGECSRARWLALRPAAPLFGLTWCCSAHAAAVLGEPAPVALQLVPPGDDGLLLDA